MVARARRRLAFALRRQDWLDEAAAVCSDAADTIAPTDASSPEALSLWGSLQLTEAVAAIRNRDASAAWRLLGEARAAAQRVGPGHINDYWEAFGPANVGAHEVAVALEAENPDEALQLAERVDVEELLPMAQRRATFLIDVAHA
ncbi:MAG: hypothetical protein ACRD0K_17150 [Egibacteraceae bacterium]